MRIRSYLLIIIVLLSSQIAGAIGLSAAEVEIAFKDKSINIYARRLLQSEVQMDQLMTIGPDYKYFIEETDSFYRITRSDFFLSSKYEVDYTPKRIIIIPKADIKVKAVVFGRPMIPYYSGLISSSVFVVIFLDDSSLMKEDSVLLNKTPMILQNTIGRSEWTKGNIQTFELLIDRNMIERKELVMDSFTCIIQEIEWREK
jgi:hypothetical protein